MEFDGAHLLKKVSYVCVVTGLLISMYPSFRQAEEGKTTLAKAYAVPRTEISEPKQAEEAPRQSKERFPAVVDNSPTKIPIKDVDERYTLLNRRSEILSGVTNEEARGKPASQNL